MFAIIFFCVIIVQTTLGYDETDIGLYGCDFELSAENDAYPLPPSGDLIKWSKNTSVIFNYRTSDGTTFWDAAYQNITTTKYDINNVTSGLIIKNVSESDSDVYYRKRDSREFSVQLNVIDAGLVLTESLQIQHVETMMSPSGTLYSCLNDVVTLNATTLEISGVGVPDITWKDELGNFITTGTSESGSHIILPSTAASGTYEYTATASICDVNNTKSVTLVVQDIESALCDMQQVTLNGESVTTGSTETVINEVNAILNLTSAEVSGLGYPTLTWQLDGEDVTDGISMDGYHTIEASTLSNGEFVLTASSTLCTEACILTFTLSVEEEPATESTTTAEPSPDPCPVWCIVVIVIVILFAGVAIGVGIFCACRNRNAKERNDNGENKPSWEPVKDSPDA